MLANVVVELFVQGGPIMWPILLAALAGIAVVGERCVWWGRESRKKDARKLQAVLAQLEEGDLAGASQSARGSEDPAVRMIWRALEDADAALPEALQLAVAREVKRADKFLPVMDTLVTLAPLLGLLGTVTGIMGSFQMVGGEELAVQKVTGGIGEALIATAAGLGIAIVALVPLNYFRRRLVALRFHLETTATQVELIFKRLRKRGLLPERFAEREETANV
jgi:biopolymer transport protein ExbB